MAATDDDLQQVCEGPRDWYLDDDDDLRKAFSAEQIEFATTGKADYMRYGTGGHKYEEGALAVGDGGGLLLSRGKGYLVQNCRVPCAEEDD